MNKLGWVLCVCLVVGGCADNYSLRYRIGVLENRVNTLEHVQRSEALDIEQLSAASLATSQAITDNSASIRSIVRMIRKVWD